jgi:hypothetical protein
MGAISCDACSDMLDFIDSVAQVATQVILTAEAAASVEAEMEMGCIALMLIPPPAGEFLELACDFEVAAYAAAVAGEEEGWVIKWAQDELNNQVLSQLLKGLCYTAGCSMPGPCAPDRAAARVQRAVTGSLPRGLPPNGAVAAALRGATQKATAQRAA